MTELAEYDDSEIFAEYDQRVSEIAFVVTEELNALNRHSPIDGRDWCEEHDVPERVFSDAMKHFTEGVEWGISPMYPMRSEEEANAIQVSREVNDVTEASEEEAIEELGSIEVEEEEEESTEESEDE